MILRALRDNCVRRSRLLVEDRNPSRYQQDLNCRDVAAICAAKVLKEFSHRAGARSLGGGVREANHGLQPFTQRGIPHVNEHLINVFIPGVAGSVA